MEIQEVNKLIKDTINKYDLEGHEDVFGGMVWFVNCLHNNVITCIDDHYKFKTFSFSTPKYDGSNADEIYEIIKNAETEIKEKYKDKLSEI